MISRKDVSCAYNVLVVVPGVSVTSVMKVDLAELIEYLFFVPMY